MKRCHPRVVTPALSSSQVARSGLCVPFSHSKHAHTDLESSISGSKSCVKNMFGILHCFQHFFSSRMFQKCASSSLSSNFFPFLSIRFSRIKESLSILLGLLAHFLCCDFLPFPRCNHSVEIFSCFCPC